jgi:Flp pilus assembly pilin Flp
MFKLLIQQLRIESGATLPEYSVLLSVVFVIALGAVQSSGQAVESKFTSLSNEMGANEQGFLQPRGPFSDPTGGLSPGGGNAAPAPQVPGSSGGGTEGGIPNPVEQGEDKTPDTAPERVPVPPGGEGV